VVATSTKTELLDRQTEFVCRTQNTAQASKSWEYSYMAGGIIRGSKYMAYELSSKIIRKKKVKNFQFAVIVTCQVSGVNNFNIFVRIQKTIFLNLCA
jgi:hypothetical protein